MSNQSRHSNAADTIPEVPVTALSSDTLPDQAGVYVPPRPLAPLSDHRTIEINPVLLAAHVDPRRAPTELRLVAPPRRGPHLLRLIGLGMLLGAGGVAVVRLVDSSREPGAEATPSGLQAKEPAVITAQQGEARAAAAVETALVPPDPPATGAAEETSDTVSDDDLTTAVAGPQREAAEGGPSSARRTERTRKPPREPWLD